MNQFVVGAVCGAAVALTLAPTTGRNVRAKLKDKARHLEHELGRACEFVCQKKNHLMNKAIGLKHDACKVREQASEVIKDIGSGLMNNDGKEENPGSAKAEKASGGGGKRSTQAEENGQKPSGEDTQKNGEEVGGNMHHGERAASDQHSDGNS